MSRRFLLPMLLLALAVAAVAFAIRFAGRGRQSEDDLAKLWAYLRWAAQHSAYGDEAVEAAGSLPGTDAEGILEFALARFDDAFEDDDRAIRALYVLAKRGEAGLPARIMKCVEEGGEAFVGEWAGRALARIPGPEATARLLELARSEDSDAKRAAVLALAGRDGAEARATLVACLADPDEEIAAVAAGALAAAGDPEGTRAAEAVLGKEDDYLDAALAHGLTASGDDAGLPLLDRLLARESAEARAAATRALGHLGDRAPPATLARLLTDPDSQVRIAAAASLARALRSEAGAEELARAIGEEPDLDIRVEALRALAALHREADRRLFETWFRLPADDEAHRRLKIWAAAALLELANGR
ncbi:MAG: HEAT repeat domain-containing protein [Planctomycetes bacterium]|nr:HEAT repeat domain-containing protein [Planctomycetota bacterium]